MASRIHISPASAEDYPDLLDCNEAAVPAVNSITAGKLAHLHRQSSYFGVARAGADIAGFLLALPPHADYDSINFGYFKRSYRDFVYIDRIIVSPAHRRLGVGAALYADLERTAPARLLACEVNVRPPNHPSLAFHERLGFTAVAEQDTEGGDKRVCLMVRATPDP